LNESQTRNEFKPKTISMGSILSRNSLAHQKFSHTAVLSNDRLNL